MKNAARSLSSGALAHWLKWARPCALRCALACGGAALVTTACSNLGSFCDSDRTSPCPNDPAQTSASKQACHDAVTKEGNCAQQYSDYYSCAYSHSICTADGHLDRVKTASAANANCSSQFEAYNKCKAQQAADGGV